jgi:hypothetical protein
MVRDAKPRERAYKLWDERGLYLFVSHTGARLWRFKYQFAGKEQTLVFGAYPELTLEAAREKRDEALQAIREGRNPSRERKAAKLWQALEAQNSLKSVALAFVAQRSGQWSERHRKNTIRRLENHVFPAFADRPIFQIEPPELLAELRKIEASGAVETAARVRTLCVQIFRYGVSCGMCSRNSVTGLKKVLLEFGK